MFQGMDYVYIVYKEKSFSKAAQKLFISQPSLSATVKRVEKKIGYPIFDRSTKPLTLTTCGEQYIRSVENILASKREFSNYISDWTNLKTGSLNIGGSSLYSSWVLPPLMSEFNRQFPLIKVNLIEKSSAELAGLLQKGELDFMIDNRDWDSSIFSSQLYQKEHLILAVPSSFSSTKRALNYQLTLEHIKDESFLFEEISPVPLELFQEDPFILLKPNNDTRIRARELFLRHSIQPNLLFQLDQQLTAYNITCSGMGISFVSDTLITRIHPDPSVCYYKLDEPISSRNLSFFWKTERYFTRAMEEFLRITRRPQ